MATIVKSAAEVIERAETVIAGIKAERTKRDEETIAMVMGEKRFSFRKGFYYMNREEAVKYIRADKSFGIWGFSWYAWGDLDKAEGLLKMAQNGEPITLNMDDVRVLY